MKRLVLVCATVLGLGSATAVAAPCNTVNSTGLRDAGSGPTPGSTGATVGANAGAGQHPPTNAMNQQAGTGPASSEDAQKQMQGQPTAAQQAEGVKGPAAGKSGNDC
ncbi:MAG: hypothetical protein ABW213_09935 [Tardiphaga sp.]